MMRFSLLFYLLLFASAKLYSQESLGLHLDKYSGTDLMLWNPGLSSISPNNWDIKLGSGHIFGYSDYGFLRNGSLTNITENAQQAEVIDARFEIPTDAGDIPLVIFDTDGGDKRATGKIDIAGPAALFKLKDKFQLGLFTRLRAQISVPKIPESIGIYELNDARFSQFALDLEPFDGAGMYWMELGGHFSMRLNEQLTIGTNLKYLLSSEGAYVSNETDGSIAIDPDVLSTNNQLLEASLGITTTSINTQSFSPFSELNAGSGFGIDLGVSYQTKDWYAGISLIDVGSVNYNQNTEQYQIASDNTTLSFVDYEQVSTPRELLDLVARDFDIDPLTNPDFSIGLPTALTMQASVKWNENLNISASLIQRIPLFANSLKRDNSLAIVPNYSTKWISVFAPLTLHDYSKVRLGLAARIGFVTIGSDHLGTIFRKHDFRGSDLYIRVALYPFNSRTGSTKKGKLKGKHSLDCYDFG